MRDENLGMIVLVIFMVIIGVGIYHKVAPPTVSDIVETRREHLVFQHEGCQVFQVRIEDEDGIRHIYVAVPKTDKHGRLVSPTPRCQVTAH